jgi:tetratricopeptide (TPR) repeat protein
MGSGQSKKGAGELWQVPLFLAALGLFAYAALKWVDIKPGATVAERIKAAEELIEKDRPEAAIEVLNTLLNNDKLPRDVVAMAHLDLARAIDAGQKSKKLNLPANHITIIEQTRAALADGAKLEANDYKRMGDSFEALDRAKEALENFRRAIAIDPSLGLGLQKKIIELQVSSGDTAAADESLETYLGDKSLAAAERAWALGERAQIAIDDGRDAEAKSLLAEAAKIDNDPVGQGVINYRLGYCAWKLGNPPEAERYLRLARQQLKVAHPLDADAAWLLGKIFQERNEAETANSFFNTVLMSHPESRVAPLALLGRGICRVMAKQDDPGLEDLHELINRVAEKGYKYIFRRDVVEGMRKASSILASHENYAGALEVLAYEQTLEPTPGAGFFARLENVYEKRADQLEADAGDVTAAEKQKRADKVRDFRLKAGDACIAYSRALTLTDDKGYGDALWKGVDLYDRAQNVQRTISALETFVNERPDDTLAPEATLRLGRAYQAAGSFDKAISTFQRAQFRYPKSLAASKSAVPLAQAFIAKGPDQYKKAEDVLLGVVENNPLLTPQAEEFREALFELAQLYYRTARYEEAIARLEELTQRYPKEERMGQLLFTMAASYRKSAMLISAKAVAGEAAPASSTSKLDPAEAQAAKKDRIGKAKALFDQVIEIYRTAAPTRELDKLQLKLAHFYRADCLYDLGQYEEAIKLYDGAAFKYQEDPSALAAYVQIVNAYCALGKPEEAKTANERAKWLLRKMPQEAFTDGSFAMPKAYWEQWLKWTGESGMW